MKISRPRKPFFGHMKSLEITIGTVGSRVHCPILKHVPKAILILGYLNIGTLCKFFLLSICWNVYNLAVVIFFVNVESPKFKYLLRAN